MSTLPLIAIEYNQGQAVHLHHAHETRRRLESDSVQLVRLHEEGLRNQLHRNAQVSALKALAKLMVVCIECKSTQTVELGEYTSRIDYTLRMSYHQSSNYSCQ